MKSLTELNLNDNALCLPREQPHKAGERSSGPEKVAGGGMLGAGSTVGSGGGGEHVASGEEPFDWEGFGKGLSKLEYLGASTNPILTQS